jgi:response regulator RpfG family c-di-GMP phosphodiesterase
VADPCKPDKILVVDDEANIRQIIIRVLEQRGYRVKEAANGAQALDLLREEPFDLVITDLRMPQMEGLELLERARELYPETDFIILTAHGTIESAVWAMQRGADDYLTKPFDVRDLELKVSQCFERRRRRHEARRRSPLEPLVELGRILSSQTGLPTKLEQMLEQILDLMRRTFAPNGIVMTLFDPQSQQEVTVIQSGLVPEALGYPRLSYEAMRQLAQRPRGWCLREAGDAAPLEREAQSGGGITVPLFVGEEMAGELTLVRQPGAPRYTPEDAQLLQIFGFQVGIAVLQTRTRQRLLEAFQNLRQVTVEAVQTLFAAVGTYDQYTHDHSQRVAQYAYWLGQRVGLVGRELEAVRIAGLLHDIGKLGVADETLHKNGRLTSDEFDRVKLHPVMGARILMGMEAFAEAVPLVLHHHEHYDGKGYPDGLAGEAIPLGARIIAVVDAFDSMTSDRPYRPALSVAEAFGLLRGAAGTQLDGHLVEEWIALVQQEPEKVSDARLGLESR